MPIVPSLYVHQSRITPAVDRALRALAPDVVRIRYSLSEDWIGEPAIFFRIVLSDDASREARLREIAPAVSSTVLQEVNPEELGLQYYFNFRSVSEQAHLKEESWA